jgi:hypothetical protein
VYIRIHERFAECKLSKHTKVHVYTYPEQSQTPEGSDVDAMVGARTSEMCPGFCVYYI